MMTKSRRKFDAAFKVKVALEASRENAMMRSRRLATDQISGWKRQLIENTARLSARRQATFERRSAE
jgi:transposase